ncbi:hypothetical protein CLAVI_000516 [Candidatus Clavichlamydia salmonicola]|uniref:hypothetical protein n=1 Tax=Candidatus Clavichlamydia salmonicola TaxID=469812 RepID=UPI0018919630|nr:hypothetical protein [Candidatus Clavichlamydia salmonicola]MBF5050894.1 hypothetical protein [Candidatus Clavichlamydia salmonicola]
MAIIEGKGIANTAILSEEASIKHKITPAMVRKIIAIVFVISLIIAVCLLLVAFLTPGISSLAYVSILITAGCLGNVALGALLISIVLKYLFSKGEIRGLMISSTHTSLSSDDVFELGISGRDWKKFDEKSQQEMKALLKAAHTLKVEQQQAFAHEYLIENFLAEIFYSKELTWKENKLSIQAAGQALSDAIFGTSDDQRKIITINGSEEMLARVKGSRSI